jgi:predicted GNAT family N-acyltransferase
MAQLSVFTGSDLPEAHAHQIRSFIRLHWDEPYLHDIDAPLVPPERNPRHVVMAERHAVFSHARVVHAPFRFGGDVYRLYGVGDVFTYPAFRKRGFGGEVMARATALIREDAKADLAILFCDETLESFYAQHGWRAVPSLEATAGDDADGTEPLTGLPMLLSLSDRARRLRPEEAGPWRLPGHGW